MEVSKRHGVPLGNRKSRPFAPQGKRGSRRYEMAGKRAEARPYTEHERRAWLKPGLYKTERMGGNKYVDKLKRLDIDSQ